MALDILKISDGEEWIWVEGYKGTDKDMVCRDYQFEMNKQFDIPADTAIEDCKSGFHLCLNLKDVFGFYGVKNGNRFFRVRAYVRRKDFDEYCLDETPTRRTWNLSNKVYRNKLAARSIIFLYEMTADEILKAHPDMQKEDLSTWSEETKKIAIMANVYEARKIVDRDDLIGLGYSLPFAEFVVKEGGYEVAKAVGSQEELSMDVKALFILESLLCRAKVRDTWASSATDVSAMNSYVNSRIIKQLIQ